MDVPAVDADNLVPKQPDHSADKKAASTEPPNLTDQRCVYVGTLGYGLKGQALAFWPNKVGTHGYLSLVKLWRFGLIKWAQLVTCLKGQALAFYEVCT